MSFQKKPVASTARGRLGVWTGSTHLNSSSPTGGTWSWKNRNKSRQFSVWRELEFCFLKKIEFSENSSAREKVGTWKAQTENRNSSVPAIVPPPVDLFPAATNQVVEDTKAKEWKNEIKMPLRHWQSPEIFPQQTVTDIWRCTNNFWSLNVHKFIHSRPPSTVKKIYWAFFKKIIWRKRSWNAAKWTV